MHETIQRHLDGLHRAADDNDPAVMERVMAEAARRSATTDADVADVLADAMMPIDPENGRLLHVLAAARRPGRIVEFGTSHGLSTIYLAAALPDGEAPIITTELEVAKAAVAVANLEAVDLADRVDVRVGDAVESLADLDEPISLLFLDGWKGAYLPLLQLLDHLLVDGALVVADDTTLLPELCGDYLRHVRDESNGFVTAALPVRDGLEISVRRR